MKKLSATHLFVLFLEWCNSCLNSSSSSYMALTAGSILSVNSLIFICICVPGSRSVLYMLPFTGNNNRYLPTVVYPIIPTAFHLREKPRHRFAALLWH